MPTCLSFVFSSLSLPTRFLYNPFLIKVYVYLHMPYACMYTPESTGARKPQNDDSFKAERD